MAEGKKLPVSIVIAAVDNVTYKVMSINEKLKRITGRVGKVQQAFANLGEEAGLNKLARGIGKVGSTGKEFFGELASSVMKVAAMGAAAAVSIYSFTKSFADAGDEISTISSRLGLTTTAYQELRYAASRADVDQEQFNGAMDKFNKGIGEAAAGTGEAFVGFNALGISVRDSSGKIRGMEALLPLVADKLGAIRSESVRAAVASKLFGREGAKLNGIFKEGSKGLSELRAEAQRMGAVMTPGQIKAAEEFDDGMKQVGATLLMVRNIVGAALAPKIVELGKTLQTYILAHKDKITEWASAFADKLPGYMDVAVSALAGFGAVIEKVIGVVSWFQQNFGTTATVIAGFALYFSSLTIAAAKFAWALGGLVGPALKVAWVGFSLIIVAVKALVIGLAALVGWPVLIGAALIAAAIAIWKWWGPLTEMVGNVVDKVKGWFGGKTVVSGELKTTSAPALGPAFGFGKTVDAAARAGSQRNENHVLVDFTNLPQGTRVESKKADSSLDLSLGYGMVN